MAWTKGAIGLVGALAAAGLVLVVQTKPPAPDELVARGGSTEASLSVEALCFDAGAEVVKSAHASTECPAPGFVKLLYASARSAPRLAVLVRAQSDQAEPEIRVEIEIDTPGPRSILPGHARLEPGERLEVFVSDRSIDPDRLDETTPVFTIVGVKP